MVGSICILYTYSFSKKNLFIQWKNMALHMHPLYIEPYMCTHTDAYIQTQTLLIVTVIDCYLLVLCATYCIPCEQRVKWQFISSLKLLNIYHLPCILVNMQIMQVIKEIRARGHEIGVLHKTQSWGLCVICSIHPVQHTEQQSEKWRAVKAWIIRQLN